MENSKEYNKKYYIKNKEKYKEYYKKHAEYYKEYRKSNSKKHNEYCIYRYNNDEEYRKKIIARTRVKNAIRDGIINKEKCSVCGCEKSEAHHINYDEPLNIIWLCRKHHLEAHYKY